VFNQLTKAVYIVLATGVIFLAGCQTTSTTEGDLRFKFVPTSGGDVEYFEAANPGDTGVVVFHGNIDNGGNIIRGGLINISENIRTQMGVPVFAIARPGFGKTAGGVFRSSADEKDRQGNNVQRVVEAIDGIMKSYKLKKMDFVGFSGGGDIASIVALLRPEIVRKIVVYGAEVNPAVSKAERKKGARFKKASDYEMFAAKVLKGVDTSSSVEWHILYGEKDTIVPARAGLMFADELKSKGFKVTTKIMPGAGHFDFFLKKSPVVQEEIIARLKK
jgi:pimeloyl-ACP methyl ester carboxylesterase